jgi:hypothetical protein
LVQSGAQSFSEFHRVVVCPEMHEEQPGLFVQHVTVECGHRNPVLAKSLDDGIDFFRRQGLKLSLAGGAIGLVAALALSRAIRGLLYQTETGDMRIYLLTAVLLLFVTAVASYLPAAKAARTDPMKTFREV